MSKRKAPKPTTLLSSLILIGLIAAGFAMYSWVEPKADVAREVWDHFKMLSLIAVGYYFGRKPTGQGI
jgi:hypothetical protein